jgi:hypothetical protein
MNDTEAAACIGRWEPSSVSEEGAAFAREVVTRTGPEGRERAENLLWAAGKLADYAASLGLGLVPEVVLHPSAAERFARCAPGLSGAARRTLRTSLRFTGRRVVPQLYPAGLPLPRERAKAPYSQAEISGYLALADAQPTRERRMRAAGLACPGAGAGLIRGDLRDARGTDVACRSGGVVVEVRGPRALAVPVLARYHAPLLAAARFAGTALICGGDDPGRRNITNPLISALDGGGGLPRLDTSRLRATWLADCAEAAGAGDVHARGRDQLLPAARRPGRGAGAGRRGRGGPAARRRARAVTPLAALEEVIDASGAAPVIEAMLPIGVRGRQLSVRTLLAGMCLAQADHRPAHLTRVRQALTAPGEGDQRRLGVIADWKHGPHRLTCRQTERTFGLVADALAAGEPGGLPSGPLQAACDGLLEASVPEELKDASASLAVDWTDLASFSRPPPHGTSDCADPEASWGHRKNNLLRSENELFYGYYLSAGIMMPEENGPAVPELARRAALSSCRRDPVRAFAPVLTAMPGQGIPLGDILDDSGYAHRDAAAWAIPLRAAGAQLVQDLHPRDRGPKGTRDGAVISNGSLYCPRAPRPLLELGPLARTATRDQAAGHDRRTAELARYKLGRLTSDDPDGYHRVQCPAVMGKIRCPLRPASMRLDRDRPEILQPPEHPQACCTQQTITVPPDVLAKTAQKHDYPSAAWRRSYARRTGAERGFATAKDPATNGTSRGWCRLMGLTPLMLAVTCLLVVRNQRILHAWTARQEETQRRAAAGLPPKTRRRRRRTLAGLAAGPP